MLRTTAALLVALALFGCGGPGRSVLDRRSPFTNAAGPRPDACKEQDRAAAKAEWVKLRTTYPYHLQTIAVSPAFSSGCRAVIVTEPPPGTTVRALQQLAPELLRDHAIERHLIGYDGWTADVVFTIPPLDGRPLAEISAELHRSLFGTTYRMQTIDTNARPPALDPRATPLDVTVGPGDLNRWLLVEQSGEFRPLRGGSPLRFRKLLETKEAGIYVDARHGLVSWVIPRRADIDGMRALVRQFAMESDLIVGAVASWETVAIVARRRIVDPLVLQPLRFETVSLLAAVGHEHLAQSYERNHFLAGKTEDRRDWAPILLSPELIDTEYGSVLNITDQLLKSWSQNGTIRYINFDYPAPSQWAFRAPLNEVIESRGDLTFNWNTRGAGATIEIGDLDVFWLRRTGALNVSYFPSGDLFGSSETRKKTEVLEEQGHNFFARSQDPLLVRVVQYNALYQIFKRYDLTSSFVAPTDTNTDSAEALRRTTKSTLHAIRNLDKQTMWRRIELNLPSATKRLREDMLSMFESLSARLKALGDDDLDALTKALAEPRSFARVPPRLLAIKYVLDSFHNYVGAIAAPDTREEYARAIGARAGTWIHTPSIVLSWSEKSPDAIGGHNLDAPVDTLRYEPLERYSATEEILDGAPVTTVGRMELDRVVLGRQGATLAARAELREPRKALGIQTDPPPQRTGWHVQEGPDSTSSGPRGSAPADYDVQVTKQPDGYLVVHGKTRTHYETTTLAGASELVLAAPGTKHGMRVVETRGFNPDELRGFRYSIDLMGDAGVAGIRQADPTLAGQVVEPSKIKVGQGLTQTYADGAGMAGVTLEIPIAAKSIKVSLRIAYRHIAPQQLRSVLDRAQQRLRSFLPGHRPASIGDFGLELRELLKQVAPDSEFIELSFELESADMRMVEREPLRDARGASRHAG